MQPSRVIVVGVIVSPVVVWFAWAGGWLSSHLPLVGRANAGASRR